MALKDVVGLSKSSLNTFSNHSSINSHIFVKYEIQILHVVSTAVIYDRVKGCVEMLLRFKFFNIFGGVIFLRYYPSKYSN